MLLSRGQIETLADPGEVMANLRNGFIATANGDGSSNSHGRRADSGGGVGIRPLRVRTDLPGPGTATALLPGLLAGVPAYTVKVNAKFPGATPALRGVVCLHDLRDGQLLALLDSATVTALRTGFAAALATDRLARPGGTLAVIGAGAQARLVVRGLARLRSLSRITVYDLDPAKAETFAAEHRSLLDVQLDVVPKLENALARAGIVVLSTWSRAPLVKAADLRAGLHVTSLGADEPGKIELSAEALLAGRVVVDDIPLALAMGAIGNVGLTAEAIHATIGQVLSGECVGRADDEQVTLYAPVGLPWQDLAVAWPVYRASLDSESLRRFDFQA